MKKKIIWGSASALTGALLLGSFFVSAPGAQVDSQPAPLFNSSFSDSLSRSFQHTVRVGSQEFSASELGLSYDPESLRIEAFSNFWSFMKWGKNSHPTLSIDSEKAAAELKSKLKDYTDPVDSQVTFNGKQWVSSAAADGHSVDFTDLLSKIQKDRDSGVYETDYELSPVAPDISSEAGADLASKLNGLADGAGFFSGDNSLSVLQASEISTLLKVEKENEELVVEPQSESIEKLVAGLPDRLNKTKDDGSAVVDENGKILKTLDSFSDGFSIGSTDNVAEEISTALRELTPLKIQVEGTFEKANVNTLYRRAEVNQTQRMAYFYENDNLVASYPVAVGKASTPTSSGNFHVQSQLTTQNMGCSARFSYCTPNVPWISYFNGDQGFHGTYWHNDFGNPSASRQSHGCVNMRIADAKWVYEFLQVGSPVSVHW
jgi:hypothetical protein